MVGGSWGHTKHINPIWMSTRQALYLPYSLPATCYTLWPLLPNNFYVLFPRSLIFFSLSNDPLEVFIFYATFLISSTFILFSFSISIPLISILRFCTHISMVYFRPLSIYHIFSQIPWMVIANIWTSLHIA